MIAFALFGLALSPRVHRHAEASALDVDADEQQMSLTDFEHKFKVDGRFRTVRSPAYKTVQRHAVLHASNHRAH